MDIEVDGRIPLARPVMDTPDVHAAERVLRSGRLVLGPENQSFEARLADLTGRSHAVCVTSGTTALELALWALGDVEPRSKPGPRSVRASQDGREVLVPASGFPAAVNATLRAGLVPVGVDIEPGTWTIDVGSAGGAVSERTWALVAIDMLGVVAEAEPLRALARRAGIHLIDDAACSLGGFDARGVAGGSYGVAGILSFHPRKVVTTGEGGAVVCDDEDLAARLRELRNQGQAEAGRFVRAGTNARMPELAAAVGQSQLARLDSMLSRRALLVRGYHERLAHLAARGTLSWQEAPDGARPAHQTFAVLLGQGIDRERVRRHMAAREIETGVASFALSRLDAYRDLPGIAGRSFPVAEALHDRGLALPLFIGMRSVHLDRVCEALEEAVA